MIHDLFNAYTLGKQQLNNRIVMAPLTRCRAVNNNMPNDWMRTYYAQRASAGLIISEGTSPSPNGLGYANIPALYNEQHVEKWYAVTDAVHQNNGRIFLQMMHTGRIGHPNNLPPNGRVIAPSAIAQPGEISTYTLGRQAYPVPEMLTINQVQSTVNEFVVSAEKAIEAGFDGVEIHAAHGYLPNQFINTASNTRTDKYGGSIANRCRFVLEIAEQMSDKIGADKVGIRISPYSYADTNETQANVNETYTYLCQQLDALQIAYVHLSHMGEALDQKFTLWQKLRGIYKGSLILCGDFTKEKALEVLDTKQADLVAFGRDYIGNPDLAERLKHNYPLTPRNRATWYTQNEVGYTDYGFYEEG